MSVYTFLNQKQIVDLLASYGITALEHCEEIPDGIENSNYLLRASGHDYVLTIFEQMTADELSAYFDFMSAATKKGFPLPAPIPNLQGDLLSFFNDSEGGTDKKHYILCDRLSGNHPENITPELCEHLGEQLGRLHNLSGNDLLLSGFTKTDLSFVIPKFDLLNNHSFLSEQKQSAVTDEIDFIETLNASFYSLPSGICHCDFFPDNALVSSHEKNNSTSNGTNHAGQTSLSGFLDWYDAKHTAFIYDLAVICISWCTQTATKNNETEINLEKQAALLAGYEKSRQLNGEEKNQWQAYLRVAAFKFWIHREIYHDTMLSAEMAEKINTKKSPEEFWSLLQNLN